MTDTYLDAAAAARLLGARAVAVLVLRPTPQPVSCQLCGSRVFAPLELEAIRVHAGHQEQMQLLDQPRHARVLSLVRRADVLGQLRQQHPGDSVVQQQRQQSQQSASSQPVSDVMRLCVEVDRLTCDGCTHTDTDRVWRSGGHRDTPPARLTCRWVHSRACCPHI